MKLQVLPSGWYVGDRVLIKQVQVSDRRRIGVLVTRESSNKEPLEINENVQHGKLFVQTDGDFVALTEENLDNIGPVQVLDDQREVQFGFILISIKNI